MIKANVYKVLKRRGYQAVDEEQSEDENIEFLINFKNGKQKGKVIYYTSKLGIDNLSDLLSPLIEEKLQILILYNSITNPALNSFRQTIQRYLKRIELISVTYFQQDILSHQLIPEYAKVEDKQRIMDIYKTEESLFPQMLTTDPVCIIMGYQIGDMIKVTSYYNFTTRQVDKEQPPMCTYVIVSSGE
jgi:DNA-directed RNA polymerase subunit H (RpoH/RPB5)